MADYDFSGLDDVLKKTPTAPIAPPVPVSAPEAAQPKYDFSSLDTPNDQAASAAKAAALFEASFRNPSEEAKKRNLSDTIQRMSGEYVSPAVMDVGEAQRQADRLAADHATRASPRTSAFLSVQENANVAMHDAKVMAQIEESFKTVVRGAPEAVGNLARYGGVLLDAAVKPFGLQSELTGFGKWIDKSLEKAIPLQPVEAGVLSEGWYSGLRSLGANTAILGTAAAVSAAFPPAAQIAIPGALLAMAASSGGSSVAKAQTAGASDLTAAALGTADAFIEYWTEKIGIKYLMDIPGLKNAFLKTAAKFTGAEMIGEQVATIGQDFTDWIALHPEKTVKEFGDERVHAALVTAVATVVGGGGQIALMKGVSALAQRDADKAEAENFGARLSEMAALTAQLETTRLHMPTAQAFWQEIAGDSSVFIDQAKLTETLAEAGVDVSVLPTAAAQMAEARPEGIEIPVSELMTGLANTKAADAIIQHVRMAPDAESIFEHNQPIDKQLEFFQQEATRAVAAETRTAAFNAEVKQIEDDLTADLTTVGTYGKQASATQAKVAGAWYATVADKWGVTPLQIRDGWTAADGRKYPGWRPRIKGTPMQGFNHGQAMLNVGLDVGATDRAQKIDADFVKAEIEKMGVKVLSGRNVPGEYELNGQMVKELTYVPRLSRPLTEAEVNQLAVATGQEAIGHYAGGKGDLWGPNAANWGAFNPEFFKDQMGGTLLGEQAALAAQQGGLEQAQSSRRPTTAKKPEDHLGEVPLTVDYTKIEPEKNKQNMALVASYPGIRFKARDATKRAEEFIQHVTANLLWLHDQIPADIRQRSKRWYDGARAITDRWSAKYGKSDAQIAAVLAVYSPQRDWFTNVSLAERTLDIVQSQQNAPWSPEMSAVADKILADEKFAMLRGAIEGKKLSDLKDRLEQAAWLRTFDEAHNNRGYRLVTPEGGFIEMATSGKGVEKKTGWPGFGTIIKALYILDDGSSKTIDNALGGEHKVRSFYNNIFHPTSDLGFVTIDTHAVAAGLLRPLSGNSVEVAHNFGGAGTATSAATGMSGTYAYYQEAYRRAAEARGLLPREMQSITWEAVRELYTMGFKHDTAKMAVVDKLWSEYEKGKRDLDSVRAGILNLAGGVERPSWVGRDSGISPEGWASTYTGELLGDSVPRRDTGDMDGGAGSGAAGGNAGSLYQAAEVRAGAVSGPVVGIHFSKAERPVLSSSAWGSGMKGAEGDYVRASADKRLRQRIAFYVNTGNGIVPESDVGSHAHLAVLENLYDADADVLKIWRNNPDERVRESAVLDAGFDGFLTRTFGKGGAVVMLGQRNLQPEYLGNYASTAWDLPKELKDKAVAAAQAVHQKLAGDTSREDMRASGKVVQVNSLQDLNETYPEAQAAAFTELLKGFGQPHDAKAVAGFMEGRTGKEALAAVLAEQSAQKLVQDRAAIPPSPEIPAAKALAMELSRNPRLVSGQQSIEGWRKDLERIEPETAKLVDWSKFESGKMYYKADLAATLWQGREQWYFSALEVALKTAPAKVFTSGKAVAQWLTANAGKMSVKAAEIEATGITDWLETQGKVTQEQVVAFMAQGGVKVEEVVLGETDDSDVEAWWGDEGGANEETPFSELSPAEQAAAREQYRTDVQSYGDNNGTKFEQYQLPGGENYREWLLTLPSNVKPEDRGTAYERETGDDFRSSHFDQPNILAHIRTNERTDADGKRVLFIEEIQSDWAQKGRKNGFNVPVTGYQVFVDGVAAGAPYESKIDAYDHKTRALKHNAPDKVEIREVQALQSAQSAGNKGLVPLAPFVTDTKSWTALALKRMIAHAVENGFDSVAWTTGEQQAARYDLSKQVSKIEALNTSDGKTSFVAYGLDGEQLAGETVPTRDLPDHVGKDLAEKISKQPAGYHEYEGLDLKVGGEGMKGYYDGIVPQVANDVLKKLGGGKVETVDLGQDSEPELDEENGGAITELVHDMSKQMGFQITQAMREAVSTNGLPLFAGTPKKGSFSPATLDLRLLADADLSTFLHETSHFFLAAYTDMASQPGAPKALVDEVNAILAHLFKTVQGGAVAGGDLAQKVGAGETARLAPNGKPSKLNAQQWAQVRTPEFKAWFGDWEKHASADNPVGALWSDDSVSKIVDENGEPLVVYHGTQQGGFGVFRPEKGDKHRSPMLFATADAGTARSYSGRPSEIEVQDQQALERWEELRSRAAYDEKKLTKAERAELRKLDDLFNHEDGGEAESQRGIYHLFLNIRSPNEVDFEGANWDGQAGYDDWQVINADQEIVYQPDGRGTLREQEARDYLASLGGEEAGYAVVKAGDRFETTNSVAEEALRMEMDGAIIRNVVDDGGKHGYGVDPSDVFVFFDSNQVKSATQNTGAFSRTDDSILHEGGEVPAPGPLPEGATPLEIWSKMSLDQQRPYHEAWAEQGEQYFMTGKAPSLALESAFRTFANWLKRIYGSLKEFVASHGGAAQATGELAQKVGAGETAISADEAAKIVANDDELFNAVADYTAANPDIFADRPDLAERFSAILRRITPYQSYLDALYRGEPAQKPTHGGPTGRGFLSFSASKKTATEFAKDAAYPGNRQVTKTTGKLQALSLESIVSERMRARPDESHYAGMQAEYFVPDTQPREADALFAGGQGAGIALHPDTAAFFDRMLATEAEIKLANEKRGFVQLFKDAAEAGMTERGFADYTALTDEQREDAEAMLRTRSLRDMKWLQNSRDKVIAALQADAKEARAAVRKTIAEELAATPLRKAMRWLKTGEMTQPDGTEIKAPGGFKMTKADVEALFPPGALADRPDLSRLRGMTATEGLAPDLVAEMFDGFTSGEDLVRQLAAAPKFNDEVEALTNQRMLEEHSDLVDPDAIAKAADAAIHNDAHIRLAATELAALNSRIGSVAALTRAAKEYARQLIETKTSRTLKPWQFAAADTRARKAAAKALRKGERDEAATQMRTALVNAAATKLAYDAEDDIKKITDRFKKIAGYKDTDSAFKSRDAELVNAVRAILADFGIGTKGKSAREYLAVVQQHNPDLAAVLSDTIDAVTENAKDWQQLKISELRDLAEEIDGLWFLAKRSKQIEIDGKVMPLHEAQQALYDRLDALGIPDRVPGEGSAVTPAEKRGILFDRFVGALRRVEAWVGAKDGTLTGPFRTYMWNPIRDAADAYRADKAKYLKAYRDLLTPIAPTLTRRLIEAPELGYTFGKDEGGMGKAELLHAILHTGNESNKRKLLLGRGWATATENSFDTSKWDAFVQRMHDEGVLTKADYDFAQGAWNLLDNMKPLAQKAHRDVFGKYFAEVTANEFTNQFGTYAGGYVPAMTDPLIVRDAELNKLRDGEEGSMAYAFPTTAKGFTKSRVEYNRPLKLDLRTLSQHIDKVLLFGHMTRPVNDVRRVMSGKSVAQALGRVDPQAYNTLIMPWLNRAAKQVVETPTPGREGLGRFWSVVRARAGMAAMFANVANSAQQITGLSLAAVRVRPALLLDAMAKYAASPASFAEHVTGKSSYMATRLENEVSMLSDQINDILLNPSIYESAKNWTSKHAYFMQSAVDSVISPVVWLGGYNQAIEAGMSETDAVRAGDSAVRETQGSQAPEDVAAFETGSAFYRMFVQFAGYFNMNANLLGTEFVKLSRDMGLKKGAGRGLYVLTLGFLAPAIAGELIIQLFRGGPDDDDKDGEYLDDWLVALFGYAPLRYATAMVPGIGPAVNATVNTLNNKPYDDRISTAPAISMIEAAVKAPIDLYKAIVEDGKPSKAIKEIATLISMTVGVPASAAAKPASYLADVAAGRVAPTSIPDAVRGTITGTASPASKQ